MTNGALCRNPRVVKEAGTLSATGYDVTVLAVRNHPASVAADQMLLQGAAYRCAFIDMLPTGGPSAFARRLMVWAARRAVRTLGWQSPRALGPYASLLREARRRPADLTIVHNEVAHCVGTRLLRDGRRVAADFEDWYSEDLLPEARAHRPLGLLRAAERELLHRAAHTTVPSHAMAAALHARYGGVEPAVITNSFPLQPIPRSHPPGDPPTFFWFSQTVGPGRGLEQFFAAWRLARQRSRVVLLGEVSGDYRRSLLDHMPEARRSQVGFLPLVAPETLPAAIAAHDIGLALEDAAIPSRDLTITNKILQYLNAGLAVVATDTRGQREVLSPNPAAGIVVHPREPESFANSLDALLADRPALRARQAAARRLAEAVYCWEHEAVRLRALVASSLAPFRTVGQQVEKP